MSAPPPLPGGTGENLPRQSPPFARAVFERYVAPARARPQIWRVAVGLVLCFAVYAAMMGAVIGVLRVLLPPETLLRRAEEVALGRTPWGVIGILFSFAALAIGPAIAARLLHRRRGATLFGRGARVARHFALGAGLVVAVYGGANLLTSLLPGEPALPGVALPVWLAFLPFALIGIAIQTLAEELVFRAYLLQQLAARFRSKVIWLGLPSLLFGLLHYDPDLIGPNALPLAAATMFFGLIAADLTARSGSIGLAWGIHFANNAAALLVLASGGALDGLALFRAPLSAGEGGPIPFLGDMVLLGIVWWAARRMLR